MPNRPTDNRFTPNVQFRTQREAAKHKSWSAHFHGCTRATINALELLAKNNPDRWVYVSVAGLQKMCNTRLHKQGDKVFSTSAYEKSLKLLRDLSVISRKHNTAPDGIEQEGFVVGPHASLCRMYPKSCNYIGLEGATGTWLIRDGRGTWVADATRYSGDGGALVQENDEPPTVTHTVIDADKIRVHSEAIPEPIRVHSEANPEQLRAKYGDRYGTEYGPDDAQPAAKQDDSSDAPAELPLPVAPIRERSVLNCSNGLNQHNTHNGSNQPAVPAKAKPKASVCDVLEKKNLSNDVAEKEVAALLTEFVAQNDGEPGKCTRNQKREMTELAIQYGRQDFRAAARAWFAAHPWDSRTTDPFSAFIAGFDGYAAKDVHASKKKKLTQEMIDASYALAKKAHCEQWGLNEDGSSKEKDPEPGPEGFEL